MNNMRKEISEINKSKLLDKMVKDFNDKYTGVDFEYVSAKNLQRVNAKQEIIEFFEKYANLFYEAGEINTNGFDHRMLHDEDISKELLFAVEYFEF